MKNLRMTALFSGKESTCTGERFEDASLTAAFGGVECHAQQALVQSDCTVRITALFGGVELHLPASVNVQVSSFCLFGGVSKKRQAPPLEGAPTVRIKAFCLFGGVEVT